jgi:hypothetical protein
MKVTAIIPSLYNVTKPYLRLCVESLRATTDWDIIVVTNGTKTSEPLNIPGVTIRLHTSDQGQCNAVNIGAQAASPTTEYFFISNDDMYYAPGWNKNLRFDHPVFSPNLVEPENNHGSAPPFRKLGNGFTLEEFDRQLVDTYIDDVTYSLQGKKNEEPGLNFPLFVKKDLWNLLGGYDIAYDPWGSNSDTDLQTRINLAGVTPMRLTDVLVYHFSNKSGTFDGTHQDFYQYNIEYFRDKFGFDRDELGSDVWYNKDMIPEDKTRIKYEQKPYIS